MECIKTYEDLRNQYLYNRKQFWYYVILVNPKDITEAGKKLLMSLSFFHDDSGHNVVYFMPGFLNTDHGIVKEFKNYINGDKPFRISIEDYGKVEFFHKDFIEFIHKLEDSDQTKWRYSGECELLLFNIDANGKIMMHEFVSYNLDHIIRNGRNLSSFIRTTINVGKDKTNKADAKRYLDEKYAELTGIHECLVSAGFQFEEDNLISSNAEPVSVMASAAAPDTLSVASTISIPAPAPQPVPYSGDQPYIFFSYSHKNMEPAQKLIRLLQNSGFRVWYDEGINPSTDFNDNIAEHLAGCSCVISLISEEYLKSRYCKDEVSFAKRKQLPQLPIYMEDITLPAVWDLMIGSIEAIRYVTYLDDQKLMTRFMQTVQISQCREG